ncbi:MAG: diaminopimelate decarboxylase [Thermoanaerobaculia bacterium]
MHGFQRVDGELFCDGVRLSDIARDVGTPVYVYSRALIEESYRRFDAAFAPVPHLVCYATKANSNLTILRILAALGAGADVVSGGELRAAHATGFSHERIVFSGVGKTVDEIRFAVDSSLLAINAESESEIALIQREARTIDYPARVALRVNPDIDAKSHPYISTGRKHNKFGVDIARAREIFAKARSLSHVEMTGIQAHIGSQILDLEPLAQSAGELARLALSLSEDGFPIETLDIGGGLGIAPAGSRAPGPEEYAAAVLPHLSALPFKILIEPGRAIVGPAGALITRVLYVKENPEKKFVITDAGMNDLLRPALYDAIHGIESVAPREGTMTVDVVGPVCETSDFFARDREIGRVVEGDLVAIRDTGAYGFAMSSNYNFRPRAAEVLVEGDAYRVIRRRETFEDLTRLEA